METHSNLRDLKLQEATRLLERMVKNKQHRICTIVVTEGNIVDFKEQISHDYFHTKAR